MTGVAGDLPSATSDKAPHNVETWTGHTALRACREHCLEFIHRWPLLGEQSMFLVKPAGASLLYSALITSIKLPQHAS